VAYNIYQRIIVYIPLRISYNLETEHRIGTYSNEIKSIRAARMTHTR